MRAFKHTSKENYRRLFDIFPMLQTDDWSDSPLLIYRAISIWDYWLGTKGDEYLLANVSEVEHNQRNDKFRKLHENIISNTEIFLAKYSKRWYFKEVSSYHELRWRLDPDYEKDDFMLLLPELKTIYLSPDNYTEVTFFQDISLMKDFDKWVADSGLKYIGHWA